MTSHASILHAASSVSLPELDEPAVQRCALRGRILKAPQARLAAAPFEVEVREYVPDFPIPPEAREKLEPEPEAPSPEEVEAAWQARMEQAVAQAREAAYQEGYAAAEAEMQAAFEEQKAAVVADGQRLNALWKDFVEKSEVLLANLAFAIAQALLEGPLPQDVRAVSTQVLAQALESFGEQTPIEISLHPDDLARLQNYGLTEDLENVFSALRWHPDPDLAVGDWAVQTPDAAIRHLKDEMLNQLTNRLGLLSVVHRKREGIENEN